MFLPDPLKSCHESKPCHGSNICIYSFITIACSSGPHMNVKGHIIEKMATYGLSNKQ